MRRALISVSDKTNIVEFAKELVKYNYEIISTGGTLKTLRDNNIEATSVSDITGFPEILDGRVKTLHPKIHGGLLSLRNEESHVSQVNAHGIDYIDMVVVNLYPFETVINNGASFEEAIENIDIGGPSMLRRGAKNFESVCVVCNPTDYKKVIDDLENNNKVSSRLSFELALKAFKHTAKYDTIISNYLSIYSDEVEDDLLFDYKLVSTLRYGENPHQSAQFYKGPNCDYSIANAKQLHGKELSYNNILDANAALNLIREFDSYNCVAIKHLNPCGVGEGSTLEEAFDKAYESDSISIFGGIVAFNQELDLAVAKKLSNIFLEIIIAPKFSEEAIEELTKKKNVRLLEVEMKKSNLKQSNIVSVNGGILVQDLDDSTLGDYECVTNNQTFNKEDIEIAWKVCKHVKSNGIVVVKDQMTVGIGVGQTSRVGSCNIALNDAKAKGYTKDLVLASDAFFPFEDAIELAHKYGVTTIIQTGGSVNDDKVIAKCNEYNITMLITGIRNFKH